MTALPLPCTLFTTQNRMDDHNAKDMQCGDLTQEHFIFFRIWFVLQRYDKFGFKPLMTNMEATVEITGGRNEKKS